MKIYIIFIIALAFSSTVFGQDQFKKLEKDLKAHAGITWSFKIDTTIASNVYLNKSSSLETGRYFGRLIIRNKLNKNHKFTIVIYESNNDSILFNLIDEYYTYASCRPLRNSDEYLIFEKKLKIDSLVLFLPRHPCFDNYSKKERKLIKKIFTD